MLQSDWGWTVVIDLFMSGFGGCLFVATAIGFLLAKDSFAKVARVGAWVSFSAVLVGVLFLLMDVGQPLRAMWMFGSFVNFESWMPRGAWSLAASMLVFLLFALSFDKRIVSRIGKTTDEGTLSGGWLAVARKACAIIGLALGLFVTTYTGFLLKGSMNIPFWNTVNLPLSFVFLSLSAGAAMMLVLLVVLYDGLSKERLCKGFAVATTVGALAATLFIYLYLSEMLSAGVAAQASVQWVLESPAFAVCAVCAVVLAIAGVVAFVFAGKSSLLKPVVVTACVVAVVAGVSFRYCVLGGGQHAGLPSLDLLQMFGGSTCLFR